MKYVLDLCVAFKTLLVEQNSDKAQRLSEGYQNNVHELLSPDVFAVEIAHAITRAERQGRISPAEGARLLTDMLNRLPAVHASLPLLPRAYHISSDARIGVYDCLYVALAEREACELVTSDEKLIRNLQPRFPFILPLASLP
jgi:predicted nucleic acid-binding protein